MNGTFLLYIFGPIVLVAIVFGALRMFNFSRIHTRTVTIDVVQGIFAGAGLSFITVLFILPNFYITKVNGWTTMFGCGESGSGILVRAACNRAFAGPINVAAEAMYWTTSNDGAGQALSGANDYILHFPAGQLPPNSAFWSLTMATTHQQFVANPIDRYSVGSNSGLVANSDGSVDIYIQNSPPTGHESNWLPAPTGNFILWLRVYLPGQPILDGQYKVPPILETSNV